VQSLGQVYVAFTVPLSATVTEPLPLIVIDRHQYGSPLLQAGAAGAVADAARTGAFPFGVA
jgi:hypothetical protein